MSHEEQIDLRIRRTHKFLQEAMIDLITEKGFDAITVGDIAERAMINRATFYRHYQDKYDLVAKIFEEATNRLVENMKPFRKETGQKAMEDPPDIWIQIFEHFAENAPLYKAMLGKSGSSWFAARVSDYTVKIILDLANVWQADMEPRQPSDPAMPPELPAVQLAHVLLGTIVWWLERDQRATPKQMSVWFYRFAFYGYLAALGYEAPMLWTEAVEHPQS